MEQMKELTDADTSMRANKITICLGNGTHTNLVKTPREKDCKGADEWNGSISCAATDGYTNHVLFSNETFNESLWIFFKEFDAKCRILGIGI